MPAKKKTIIIREPRSPKTIPPKLTDSRKPPGGNGLKKNEQDMVPGKLRVIVIREPRSPSTIPPKLDNFGKPPGGKRHSNP